MDATFNLEGYTTEVMVPEDSPAAGITVKALEDLGEGAIEIITLLRGRERHYDPAGNAVIKVDDTLILQGEPAALERLVALKKLKLARDDKAKELDAPHDEIGVMEAVITPESELVGRSAGQIKLFHLHGVNLLAVSPSRPAHCASAALGEVQARRRGRAASDLTAMPETLGALHRLPLAEARLSHGSERKLPAHHRACCRHGARRLSPRAGDHSIFRRGRAFAARPLL